MQCHFGWDEINISHPELGFEVMVEETLTWEKNESPKDSMEEGPMIS
jgi:hypothetical protein